MVRLIFVFFLLISVISCTSTMRSVPPDKIPSNILHQPPSKEAQKLWHQATLLESQNRLFEAISLYRNIAVQFPDNAIAPQALHRTGRILANKLRWNDAIAFYSYTAQTYPQWNGLPQLYLDMMEAYTVTGNPDRVLALSDQALPAPEKNFYLGLAHAAKGDLNKAISLLTVYLSDEKILSDTENLLKALEVASSSLAPDIVQQCLKKSMSDNVRIFIHCVAALQEIAQGAETEGRKRLLFVRQDMPSHHPMLSFVEKLLQRTSSETALVKEIEADPGVLCLLVPLKGDFASYGRNILRGAFIAVDEWNTTYKNDPVTLIIHDTPTSDGEVIKLLEEAIQKERALAILGPLGMSSLNQVLSTNYATSVLIAAFVPNEPRSNPTPFHLRMLPGITESVKSLVGYSIKSLGIHSYGIMYPADSFGEKAKEVFYSAVREMGGEIKSSIAYAPKKTDFEDSIQALLSEVQHKSNSQSTPFQAIFLPDDIHTVSIIAPQLLYYNVVGVTLLGSQLWDHPHFEEMANGYLEGSYYVTPFSNSNLVGNAGDFAMHFQEVFGANPDLLDAIGYDTTKLILQIRNSLPPQRRTRRAMIEQAANFKAKESLTGIEYIEPNGYLQRIFRIMSVTSNKPIQVFP